MSLLRELFRPPPAEPTAPYPVDGGTLFALPDGAGAVLVKDARAYAFTKRGGWQKLELFSYQD